MDDNLHEDKLYSPPENVVLENEEYQKIKEEATRKIAAACCNFVEKNRKHQADRKSLSEQ